MIRIEGNYYEAGVEIGRYWGAYFSLLRNAKRLHLGQGHRKLFEDYKGYLTDRREDKKTLRKNVEEYFPEIYDEIKGMLKGVNEYKEYLGFKTEMSGLFACILGETDENYKTYCGGCSTVVFKDENGYYMIHSDENDKIYPLVVANVTLCLQKNKRNFVSVSHPFQLFGSAVGLNEEFVFQGNSIPCSEEVFDKREDPYKNKKRIPKTILSRKLLDLNTPEQARKLYNQHPSTLPNNHILITKKGVYSLRIKPSDNVIAFLEDINLKKQKLFCHTNHFKNEDDKKWSHNENKESKARLKELEKCIRNAKDYPTLENYFLKFINEYKNRNGKLIKSTSGIFFFKVPLNGTPTLHKTFLNYGFSCQN